MKKILYFLSCLPLFSSLVLANDTTLQSAILNTSAPSDKEIMEVIKIFNFDENQTQQIFNETKQQLNKIYNNSNQEELKKIILPEVEKIERNIDIKAPKLKDNPKKLN